MQQVRLDGRLGDEQPRGRTAVRLALRDQREDLELTVRKRGRCVATDGVGLRSLPTSPCRDRRRQHRRTARGRGGPPDALVSRGVLQQVAGRSRLERRNHIGVRESNVVSTRTRRAGFPVACSRRIAVAPSTPGMRRSMSTTSGRRASASSTAWPPSPVSPHLEIGRRRRTCRATRRARRDGRRRSPAGSGPARPPPGPVARPIAGSRADIAVPIRRTPIDRERARQPGEPRRIAVRPKPDPVSDAGRGRRPRVLEQPRRRARRVPPRRPCTRGSGRPASHPRARQRSRALPGPSAEVPPRCRGRAAAHHRSR